MTAVSREHVVWEELTAGHALGALEPDEEQALLLHLPSCDRCARDLVLHRDTAAHLAAAAPDPGPLPEGMAARLRAAVEAESPGAFAHPVGLLDARPGTSSEVRSEVRSETRPEALPAHAPAGTVPLVRRRGGARPGSGHGRRDRRPALLAAAAGVTALVLGLGATTVALQQQTRDSVARGDRLASAVRALGEAGRSVPLRDPADESVAAVAVLHDRTVSLVVDGLAPSAEDSTYVLWEVSRFGGKTAVGTFDVRGDGVEVLEDLPLQGDPADLQALAVTAEPGDAAPAAPGGAPVAVGTVEA